MTKNVLVLCLDEMAPWVTEPGSDVHIPNIRALMDRGMTFTQAYTPSPICVPARASMATGRYLHEIGCWSSAEPYDGAVPSWGHVLQDAGIHTASIGKLHYRRTEDPNGFAEEIVPMHIKDGVGWVQSLLRRPMCAYEATEDMSVDIGIGDTSYQTYDLKVAEATEAWLAAPERTQPWAAFVSFVSPHYPLRCPEEDFALYDPRAYEGEADPIPDHPILREMADFWDHDRFFTPETRGIARAAYRGLCTFADRQVGRVLAALEASGQADDTLVLLCADHGELLGQYGFWGKSTMHDASVRVPLIAAGPGISPGQWDAPVSLIDLAPTITEALGQAGDFPGTSLLAPDSSREVISEYHDGGASVGITMLAWTDDAGFHKYVHYAEGFEAEGFGPGDAPDLGCIGEGRARLLAHFDPEDANRRAHADQSAKVQALGGRDALLARPQWNFTPTGT